MSTRVVRAFGASSLEGSSVDPWESKPMAGPVLRSPGHGRFYIWSRADCGAFTTQLLEQMSRRLGGRGRTVRGGLGDAPACVEVLRGVTKSYNKG